MKTMRNYLSQLTEYLFGVYGLGSKTIMYKFTCQKFCTAKATLKLEDELGVGGHAFNPSRGKASLCLVCRVPGPQSNTEEPYLKKKNNNR